MFSEKLPPKLGAYAMFIVPDKLNECFHNSLEPRKKVLFPIEK